MLQKEIQERFGFFSRHQIWGFWCFTFLGDKILLSVKEL